jgi:hypothetical protein
MTGQLDSGTAAAIVRDIATGTPIAKSAVDYGAQETQFRKSVEVEWEAYLKAHPRAQLDVPTDVDGLP